MKQTIFRIILIVAGIIATVWFVIPKIIFAVLNIGNLTGIAVGLLLLAFGIFYRHITGFFKKISVKKSGRILTGVLSACVLFPVLTAIILSGFMISANLRLPSGDPVLIVLGCRVIGHSPSLVLAERLNAACDYLLANPDSVSIVSGGKGSDEIISEAQCMHDWLIAHGIEKERIYMEDRSTSTRENLSFSNEILRSNSLGGNIAIVTSEFHMYRAQTVARKLGLNAAALPGHTNMILFPTYVIREWYGILYEWLGLN